MMAEDSETTGDPATTADPAGAEAAVPVAKPVVVAELAAAVDTVRVPAAEPVPVTAKQPRQLERWALSPRFLFGAMVAFAIISLVATVACEEPKYFGRLGNLISLCALLLLNRSKVRGACSASTSDEEEKQQSALDTKIAQQAILAAMAGILIAAFGEEVFKVIFHLCGVKDF